MGLNLGKVLKAVTQPLQMLGLGGCNGSANKNCGNTTIINMNSAPSGQMCTQGLGPMAQHFDGCCGGPQGGPPPGPPLHGPHGPRPHGPRPHGGPHCGPHGPGGMNLPGSMTDAGNGLGGLLKGLGQGLGGMFSGIGNMMNGLLGGVMKMFGGMFGGLGG